MKKTRRVFQRNSRSLFLSILLVLSLISGCSGGAFNNEEPRVSSGALSLVLSDGVEIEGAHVYSQTIELTSVTAPEKITSSEICAQEGTSCDGCSFTGSENGTFPISLSAGSGSKTFSYKTRNSKGTETACKTVSLTLTDLDSAPSAAVSGKGKFSDRIYYDGSRECGGYPADLPGNLCFPGGFFRKVITAHTTCDGLSLADSGSHFLWTCSLEGGFAAFKGVFQLDGTSHRVGSLIDSGVLSFKKFSLTLTVNGVSQSGQETVWWEDPLVRAPLSTSATQSLALPDTLYWVDGHTGYGYDLVADGIGLIGSPSETLTIAADSVPRTNCHYSGATICLIGSNGQHRHLIEPPILNKNGLANEAIAVFDGFRTLINGTTVTSSGPHDAGISVEDGSSTAVLNSRISQTWNGILSLVSDHLFLKSNRITQSQNGVFAGSGVGIQVQDLEVSNVTGTGLHLYEQDGSLVSGLKVSNANYGLNVQNSESVVVSNFLLTDINQDGVFTSDRNLQSYHRGTILRAGKGIHISGSSPTDLQFNNMVVGASTTGVKFTGAPTGLLAFRFSNSVVAENGTDFDVEDTDFQVFFRGNLIMDASPTCTLAGPSAGDLQSGCALLQSEGALTNVRTLGASLSDAFEGAVLLKDLSNASATLSSTNQILFSDISDWFGFLSPWRVFGPVVTPATDLFSPTSTRICEAGDNCQIYDWSLKSTGSFNYLRRRSDSAIVLNSTTSVVGSGRTYAHTALVGGESSLACPSEVRGPASTWSLPALVGADPPRTVLKLGVEVIFDHLGNDDGWCDSGEACLYTPNFGAFQGDASGGYGSCDQSGDSALDHTNDTYQMELYGNDGLD